MSDNQAIKEAKARVFKDLEKEVETLLGSELNQLEILSSLTRSIEEHLLKLYREKFPKTCNNCGRRYDSRKQLLDATAELRKQSVLFDEDFKKVQEYRNCVCGSTLMVLTDDRRDTTEFGQARRDLFNLCVEKICEATGQKQEEVIELVRQHFRSTIAAVQSADSEKEK